MNPPLDHARSGRRRILVRGVNWLGDAVMTTPALARLREARPDDFIGLLTPAKLADLWQHHPDVDQILTFASNESGWAVARRVRKEGFDLALVLPNSIRSALEMRWARIPERVGYAGQWRSWLLTHPILRRPEAAPMRKRSEREIRRAIQQAEMTGQSGCGSAEILDAKPSIPRQAHHLFEYLHLAAQIGASPLASAPRLIVLAEEVPPVLKRLGISTSGTPPLFGLNPGAEYGAAKRWPVERFVEAARQIQERRACHWLVFGGPGDLGLAEQVTTGIRDAGLSRRGGSARAPVTNLAGKTSLRELCVLLKCCRVLLTNDTGPMHVAAAVGTPVVVPFGSTSPELTGPGLPGAPQPHRLLRSNVPCSPCYLRECPIDFRCLRNLEADRVVQAVLEMVDGLS
jgi:heptosyltransferase-2